MQLIDQLGRLINIPKRPVRIISLCPSETETLAALVTPERIIGCTRYCKYPETLVSNLKHVGGTKQLDIDLIVKLEPDLLIAVREENDKAQIEQLANMFPVLILDPIDHASTLQSIQMIGEAVGETHRADRLMKDIEKAVSSLHQASGQRVLYLIWRKPYMAVGGGTFIGTMLESLGLTNAGTALSGRYPVLDDEAIKRADPELIFASSEPFPFQDKHVSELQKRFPDCAIHLVDGEAFGWHGVRTLQLSSVLNTLVQRIATPSL